MEKLVISKRNYEEIIKYCKKGLPNEACGLMAGYQQKQEGVVSKVYLMTNIKKSPEEYLLDPEEQVKVFKEIEQLDLQLISIFHSHPKTPCRPSIKDINDAYYPDVMYSIVSFLYEIEFRVFKIIEGNYREVDLEINP
ncbi:M67 family metallopeptidase [Natranaerobius trueperi]|uniref:MPN domain-containing protein n=1 Tax=Natranaerobius trueperi TaxID=759412 RepID=A0A226BX34_9FIRM|nr:M67 family metallopeptidase [Natranaerobius trueperi]OWZ82884.1 hypothetical protein CDO51_11660 [Natranaerobius trueperi]